MMPGRLARTFFCLSMVLYAAAARACTVCASTTGRQMRQEILDGHFLRTFAILATPCLVLAIAALVVDLSMPDLQRTDRA